MKDFQGFPSGSRVEFTSIPNVFFSGLLPRIDDIAELKVTLHVIAALYRKKGYPRYVGSRELLVDAALIDGLSGISGKPEDVLRRALDMAVARGTLIHLALDNDGGSEDIYFLNDGNGRQAVTRIRSGTLKLPGVKAVGQPPAATEELPNIYKLYEDNMGMLMTPLIADELRDMEKLYPEDWIRDAIKEAALHNKRNIKYIARILETWSVEGRSDGTYQRDSKETGPGKYFKGKYGHMVRR